MSMTFEEVRNEFVDLINRLGERGANVQTMYAVLATMTLNADEQCRYEIGEMMTQAGQ